MRLSLGGRLHKGPVHKDLAFTEAGIAYGAGTVLVPLRRSSSAEIFDLSDEERILALLGAAFGRAVHPEVLETLSRAAKVWAEIDKRLGALYLSQVLIYPQTRESLGGLPAHRLWKRDLEDLDRRFPWNGGLFRLEYEHQAYCLFLADHLIASGCAPRKLGRALGFELPFDLKKYNPDQPRDDHGRWTSGGGGSDYAAADQKHPKTRDPLPPRKHIERVDVQIVGGTQSDANPPSLIPGAQYAQNLVTPILTRNKLKHILRRHGVGGNQNDKEAGEFLPQYATEEGIKSLIADAWSQATPADLLPNKPYDSAMVIGVRAFKRIETEGSPPIDEPIIVGISGDRPGSPSVPTDTYVLIVDSNMRVKSLFPVNPKDPKIYIDED